MNVNPPDGGSGRGRGERSCWVGKNIYRIEEDVGGRRWLKTNGMLIFSCQNTLTSCRPGFDRKKCQLHRAIVMETGKQMHMRHGAPTSSVSWFSTTSRKSLLHVTQRCVMIWSQLDKFSSTTPLEKQWEMTKDNPRTYESRIYYAVFFGGCTL